jgi:hypothetical protein
MIDHVADEVREMILRQPLPQARRQQQLLICVVWPVALPHANIMRNFRLEAQTKTIHVRLLQEGTEVSRPTQAAEIDGGLFQILATPDYDPHDEEWEFPPGSVVRCESRKSSEGEYLLAVRP